MAKARGIGERGQIAEETEFAAPEGGVQAVEEQPAEVLVNAWTQSRKLGLERDPALAVESNAAAGDETVDMRVVGERLSPVCKTAIRPILAPRRLAARPVSAWAAARISRP